MREIIFRGKRADNGEWVAGCYCKGATRHCISKGLPSGQHFDVIPETIGEYTGLTDKNGKKIFENDIVRIKGESEDYREVDYCALIVFLNGGFCAIDGTKDNHSLRRYCLATFDYSLEVIGNIHDNPKLLEADND